MRRRAPERGEGGCPWPRVCQLTSAPARARRPQKISSKNVWVTFADKSECTPNSIISGFRYGLEIAIATEKGGARYAVSNKLPPTGQPATLGELTQAGTIKCPVSGSEFSMKSGKPKGKWCPSPIGQIILKRIVGPEATEIRAICARSMLG